MLDRIKEAVRGYLWSALGPPRLDPAAVGLDHLSHLPVHFEPPECPVCIFAEFQCHDCGGSIIDPECPFGIGMESITFNHIHIHAQVGASDRTLRVPARRKLCLNCFRLDWAKANPDRPCDL